MWKEREAKKLEREAKKAAKSTTGDLDDIENICSKCRKRYNGNDANWIGCINCPCWYHKKCTDIMDVDDLSDSELDQLEWFCEKCL